MTSRESVERLTFPSLLRSSRLARRLTQEALAEASGISVVTVSALERGARRPYRDTVSRLAQALKLSGEDRASFERAAFRGRRVVGPPQLPHAPQTDGPREERLHNVPVAVTRMFGRERELDELARSLEGYRLVTLVGPGGIGKTRLASEVARAVAERFSDGVYFVDFAPVLETSAVTPILAAALGVRDVAEQPTLTTVLAALRLKRSLLLFDNCEQLVQGCADLAHAILTNCAHVTIVATSRERLHIDGESLYRLRPLSVGGERGPAVELFLDRAAAVVTAASLNTHDVVELCRRLDGIPLALELAAARLDAMPLRQLIAGLDARFLVMHSGNRAAPARHQRLSATLDWSYDLLSEAERAAFRRCGVFSGGFTFEAFRTVCAGDDRSAEVWTAWDLLASLVNKSLVMVVESDLPEPRYALLETMRAYALEKLAATGEPLARRHAWWVAALADAAYERHWLEPRREWLAAARPDADNARAALSWSLGSDADGIVAVRIAGALGPFWAAAGLRKEGRNWSSAALERSGGLPTELVARLWLSFAQLSVAKESVDAAERAIAIYQRSGDRLGLAIAHYTRAFGLMQMGQPLPALTAIEQSLVLWRVLNMSEHWPYAAALETQGSILIDLARDDEARVLCREALRLYRAAGDDNRAAGAQLNLAELAVAAGDIRDALSLADETIVLVRRLGLTNLEAIALVNAAGYRLILGEIDAAAALARDALTVARSAQLHSLVAVAVAHLATVTALEGDARRAALLVGYVDAWYAREHYAREPTEQQTYLLLTAALQKQLPEAERTALALEGAAFSEDTAADRAMSDGNVSDCA